MMETQLPASPGETCHKLTQGHNHGVADIGLELEGSLHGPRKYSCHLPGCHSQMWADGLTHRTQSQLVPPPPLLPNYF